MNKLIIKHLLETDKSNFIFIVSNQELGNEIYAIAKLANKSNIAYFNPFLETSNSMNLLEGSEFEVEQALCKTLNSLQSERPQFFKDQTYSLISKSVKLLKRYLGDNATLLDLNTLLWNPNNEGLQMIKEFKTNHNSSNPLIQKENDELVFWFLNDYYVSMGGGKGTPKTYENCSDVRTQISKLVSNKYWNKYLQNNNESNQIHLLTTVEDSVQIIVLDELLYHSNIIHDFLIEKLKNLIFKYELENKLIPFTYIFSEYHELFTYPMKLTNLDDFNISKKVMELMNVNKTYTYPKTELLNEIIGQKIKDVRLSLNWDRQTMANELKITPTYLADIERGSKILSLQKLFYFCQRFNVSIDNIVNQKFEL